MHPLASNLISLGLAPDEIEAGVTSDELRDVWPIGLKTRGRGSGRTAIVVAPRSAETIGRIVGWAGRAGLRLQVHGGRSNVVGALAGTAEIVLRTSGLDAIADLDPVSQTITVGAGVLGGALERVLGGQGFTLGHYPQSLETSTVGGWIATRATGTASAAYGGIERLVCGLQVVLPSGEVIRIRPRPRATGGLDAIGLILGSEGSLGIVTEATLSISRRLPERRITATFPRFELALEAQRSLIQSRLPVAVSRALNATESGDVAGPDSIGPGLCLIIASLVGDESIVGVAEKLAWETIRSARGTLVEAEVGEGWWRHRFAPSGLIEGRNHERGKLFDTIEVGATWSIAAAISAELEESVSPLVDTLWLHSSHAYTSGTCLYEAFWITEDDDIGAVQTCREVWRRTLEIVERRGGVSSHHHGIGAARSQGYVQSPEGQLHRLIKRALDPGSVLAAQLLDGGDSLTRINGGDGR